MRRDIVLITEMIDAAEQAQRLAAGVTVSQLDADRQRRDAFLWNFTVLGEAPGQLSTDVREKFPEGSLAAADPAEEPDSARLLVHRSGSPAHDRHRATARLLHRTA
jgi:hypothetical protein